MRIFLVPDDLSLTPPLLERGWWEPNVEATLRRLLRPGQAAADVGANVGYHTLVMAEAIGPTGQLHAFEANPAVAQLLSATLFVNGLTERVRLHAAAALDRPGPVLLSAAPGQAGSGNIAWEGAPPSYAIAYPLQIEVPAVRLDDALSALPLLDLIRMDIEGSEPTALRGAEALIRRSPALRIVLEWSVPMMRTRTDVPRFVAWLAQLGFGFWRIEPDAALTPVRPEDVVGLPHCDLVLARGSEP